MIAQVYQRQGFGRLLHHITQNKVFTLSSEALWQVQLKAYVFSPRAAKTCGVAPLNVQDRVHCPMSIAQCPVSGIVGIKGRKQTLQVAAGSGHYGSPREIE